MQQTPVRERALQQSGRGCGYVQRKRTVTIHSSKRVEECRGLTVQGRGVKKVNCAGGRGVGEDTYLQHLQQVLTTSSTSQLSNIPIVNST